MRKLNFEKIIGLNFNDISSQLEPFEIENNEFELELEEGIKEQFYIKSQDGSFKIILDEEKRIQTIFLYPNEIGVFPFEKYTVEMGRNEIRKKRGEPNSQGEPIVNSILGISGGFDRYNKEIVYHFEYNDKTQKTLKVITLMSVKTAP